MARCEVCGNDYGMTFEVHAQGAVAAWDGTENELVLGEGQDLRLFPLDALPDRMPPHVRHYIEQLALRLLPRSP